MSYFLQRVSDGAGDSGMMSLAISMGEDGHPVFDQDARPRVGVNMRVGSDITRSYEEQDFWQTTKVTEILEETDTMVRFLTKNSEYVWGVV